MAIRSLMGWNPTYNWGPCDGDQISFCMGLIMHSPGLGVNPPEYTVVTLDSPPEEIAETWNQHYITYIQSNHSINAMESIEFQSQQLRLTSPSFSGPIVPCSKWPHYQPTPNIIVAIIYPSTFPYSICVYIRTYIYIYDICISEYTYYAVYIYIYSI